MRLNRFTLPLGILCVVTSAVSLCAQSGVLKAEVLTLPEAIRQTLANNYVIKASALGAGATRADLDAEWGLFHPGIQGSYTAGEDGSPVSTDPFSGQRPPASVVETDQFSIGVGGRSPIGTTYSISAFNQNRRGTFNGFADNYYSFGGLEVTQPLLRDFGFHANLVGVRLAKAGHESARWRYRASVMNNVTLVINAYLELDFAIKSLDTAERSRGLAQSLLDENIKRARAGDLSEADVIQARARVAAREEAILIAERGVKVAENNLKRLISDDTTVALLSRNVVIATPPQFPDHTPDPAAEFGPALERRPDYQQALIASPEPTSPVAFAKTNYSPAWMWSVRSVTTAWTAVLGRAGIRCAIGTAAPTVWERWYPSPSPLPRSAVAIGQLDSRNSKQR